MMSYYNTRHPGLTIYCILTCVSVIFLTYAPTQNWSLGFLGMAWGGFIFFRALSLLEVADYPEPLEGLNLSSKGSTQTLPTLATDLLSRMDGNRNMVRGLFALHSVHTRTILWFCIALVAFFYEIYTTLHFDPAETKFLTLAQNATLYFIIGATFWAGQTYAYSNNVSRFLSIFFLILLGVAFLPHVGLIDLSNFWHIPQGDNSSYILPILFGYSFLALLPAYAKGRRYAMNSIVGSIILLFIILCAVTLPQDTQSYALWIAAWGLFSIFWVRSERSTRKIYRLHLTG